MRHRTAAIVRWVFIQREFDAGSNQSEQSNSQQSDASHDALDKSNVPSVVDDSPHGRAVAAVNAMSLAERVGQLVMAPLYAGSDPSSLQDLIVNQHVGSVLIIGNWNSGTAGVAAATSALQSYAPANNQLLMTTDQEGGLVQHLQGAGFDQMPSATNQGSMSTNQLRQSAAVWGSQLKSAGINVDLAPVVGTVTVDRASNGPIGALYRDFGLDADGNAAFEDLELGLYLIVQSKASNGYAPIKPFLVSLPMAENGKWNYEVDASPKVGGYTPVNPDTPPVPPTPVPDKPGTPEQPTEPTNPDTPKNPDGPDSPVSPGSPDSPVAPGNPDNPVAPGNPDNPALAGHPDGAVMSGLPQTGQLNWPVPVLAVSGVLLFAAGWVLNKKEALP